MKKTFKYWAFFAFTVVMAITFAILKITGVIAWSWWWVASPVLIPFALAVAVVIIALVLAGYYSKQLKKTNTK